MKSVKEREKEREQTEKTMYNNTAYKPHRLQIRFYYTTATHTMGLKRVSIRGARSTCEFKGTTWKGCCYFLASCTNTTGTLNRCFISLIY